MANGIYEANRAALVAQIETCKAEIETAGFFHKKDLIRHLKRLERDLADYERFWKGASLNARRK